MRALRRVDASSPQRAALVEELTNRFEDYVCRIARFRWKQFRRINGADGLAEITSAGRAGFFVAVHRWRPEHGKPIAHYASRWITFSCLNQALFLSECGFHYPARLKKAGATYCMIREQSGLAEAERFLGASHLGTRSVRLVRDFFQRSGRACLSLDEPVSASAGGSAVNLHDALADSRSGVETVEVLSSIRVLRSYLTTHGRPREQFVIGCLFPNVIFTWDETRTVGERLGYPVPVVRPGDVLKPTLHLVARHLGITRERVRQIRNDVFARIRRHLRGSGGLNNGPAGEPF